MLRRKQWLCVLSRTKSRLPTELTADREQPKDRLARSERTAPGQGLVSAVIGSCWAAACQHLSNEQEQDRGGGAGEGHGRTWPDGGD